MSIVNYHLESFYCCILFLEQQYFHLSSVSEIPWLWLLVIKFQQFGQSLSGMSYNLWSGPYVKSDIICYSHGFIPTLPLHILQAVQIMDLMFCSWFTFHFSHLVACRIPFHIINRGTWILIFYAATSSPFPCSPSCIGAVFNNGTLLFIFHE